MHINWKIIAGVTAGVVLMLGLILFIFFRSPANTSNTTSSTSFGVGDERTVVVPDTTAGDNAPVASTPTQSQQKVFKVVDGPVTSATLVQTSQPTTTIARYMLQENGHVLDLSLDSAGAVSRAVSNTTIPGTVRTLWTKQGGGAVTQYLDNEVTKTLYIGFPQATTTATASQAVRIQFFPDNVTDVAVSPDGTQAAYLLATASGASGYVANIDGSGSANLFTLPFGDMLISWPATKTLLAGMRSAPDVNGVVFSVNAQNGNVTPLLLGQGVTASASTDFSHVMYQTISSGRAPRTYLRTTASGADRGLSFDPIPEKCIWSTAATSTVYCATPIQYVPPNYLTLWYQGAASLADAIVSYDTETGISTVIAAPGSKDGGVESDIVQMSISPDSHYLLFVKKGERSLWAVRLTQ